MCVCVECAPHQFENANTISSSSTTFDPFHFILRFPSTPPPLTSCPFLARCVVCSFLPHFGCFSYPLTVTHFSSLNHSQACPFSPTVHFIASSPFSPHTFPCSLRIPFITWFVRLFISTVIRQLLFSRYLFNFIWLLFALALADTRRLAFLFRSSCRTGFLFVAFYLPIFVHSHSAASVLCTLSRYSSAMAMSASVPAFLPHSLIAVIPIPKNSPKYSNIQLHEID